MTKTSFDVDRFVELLEKIIDIRYTISKELEYENSSYAYDLTKDKYDPLIAELKAILSSDH